jgi:hypothetical protein
VIRLVLTCTFLALSSALATPINFAGMPFVPPLESRVDLPSTNSVFHDFIPMSSLERFGIEILRSSLSAQVRLKRGGLTLEYLPVKGWTAQNLVVNGLDAPVLTENQLYVNLGALSQLGFSLVSSGSSNLPAIDIQANPDTPFVPLGGFAQMLEARTSRGRASRVALDVSRSVLASLEQTSGSTVRIHLENTFVSAPKLLPVGGESLSRARIVPDGANAILELEISKHATVQLSGLSGPERIVADIIIPDAPMPTPGAIPYGVNYKLVETPGGKLHLVTLEPGTFKPKLVASGVGGGKTAFEYAEASNAVVAVNGGYYDVAQSLSVDLIVTGGLVSSYARGNRTTLGLVNDDLFGTRAVWGTPKVRLALTVGGKTWNVNTARAAPNPQWLTYFVGDGFVPVGELGYTTLVVQNGVILERHFESFVPAPGQITFSFNPLAMPGLNPIPGDAVDIGTVWSDPLFSNASDVLAAGPKLVTGGLYAVNAALEGFDTSKEIWRSTKQVGIGVDQKNNWVVAYLELGTPEEFARALVAAGLKDAMRLDSGGSAQIFLAGGMLPGSGSRAVPNAIVFVAK